MVKTADGAAGPAEKSRVAVINACVDPGTSDAMVEKAVKGEVHPFALSTPLLPEPSQTVLAGVPLHFQPPSPRRC